MYFYWKIRFCSKKKGWLVGGRGKVKVVEDGFDGSVKVVEAGIRRRAEVVKNGAGRD